MLGQPNGVEVCVMHQWWAAYCEPGRELLARDGVRSLGLASFCPHERVTRRRLQPGTRNKHVLHTAVEPLYPRYLFVEAGRAADVRGVRGVSMLVASGGVPLALPGRALDRLRAAADADDCVVKRDVTKPSFSFRGRVGDRVELPLAGLVGVISSLERLDDTGEVAAWVELFGRGFTVMVKHTEVGHIVRKTHAPRIEGSVAA